METRARWQRRLEDFSQGRRRRTRCHAVGDSEELKGDENMSRSCVCGGSNENCRYCGGRGEIPDRLANALTVHSHLPESQKVHVGGTERVAAWGAMKPTFRRKLGTLLARFLKPSATAVRKPPPSPVSSSVDSPDHLWVLCPKGCGSHLRPDEVHRHLEQAHVFVPVKKQRRAKTALPSGSRLVYNICPVCKVKVRGDRLNRHLSKVHKTRSVRAAANSSFAPSSKDVLRDSTTLVAPRDKNLDATKLYAHSYRESGRFGSHPSHDGFDDESGPE